MKRLFLAICLIVVACLTARTQNATAPQAQGCGNFETATGMPGWMLVSGPGVSTPRAPTVVSPYSGWAAPIGSSKWVSVDPSRGSAAGDYTYEYTFCACKPDNSLRLGFYADNGAKVFLNSTQIFATSGSYNFTGAPKGGPYSGPAFVAGTNTLRIIVHNDGSVTGLDAVLSVMGAGAGCCH
jgi:hypothetical protein